MAVEGRDGDEECERQDEKGNRTHGSCFHLWKKTVASISVVCKNLFKNTGSGSTCD